MRKSINSAAQKFEDQITEELVLDAVPTVNSFNGVTSDGVARAIAGASGEVPQVTESDNGKVLKAVYDEGGPAVEWGEGVTVDQTYDATSTNAQSGVAVAQAVAGVNAVPASTSSDENKVLTVNASGSAEWATPAAPTVDQTYNSASTNAQSGTAVAGAIAGVNQVPAATSGDSGKVLTVNSQGTAEWDTPAAPATSGGGWAPSETSPLWSYPDGSYGGLCEDTRAHTLTVDGPYYKYRNVSLVYTSATKLITVFDPPSYKGYHNNFSLELCSDSSGTGIPSGYKAAWCQDTAKTRYYIVESGATLPTSYTYSNAEIYYGMAGGPGNVTYQWSLSLQIPQPPSTHPDYTPNPSKYTKVGNWSALTSDIHQWYLGFVNPSTGEWLSLPHIVVGTTWYVQGGVQTRFALAVARPLPAVSTGDSGKALKVNAGGVWAAATISEVPASTAADENKVLTVNSSGSPVWATAQGGGGGMLPPIADNTVRCRFAAGYTPAMGTDGNVCVDAANNVWDITDNTGWSHKFDNNQYLLEVLGARLVSVSNTSIESMFESCGNLTRAVNIELNNDLNIGSIVPARMFAGCGSLEYVHFSKCVIDDDASYMFYNCGNLVDVGGLDLSGCSDVSYMFFGCAKLRHGYTGSLILARNLAYMYADCRDLLQVTPFMALEYLDAGSLDSTFMGCRSLAFLPWLQISNTTSSLTCNNMFDGCWNAVSGLVEAYTVLSALSPDSHMACFDGCGTFSYSGKQDRAQIPSSWGGTGA